MVKQYGSVRRDNNNNNSKFKGQRKSKEKFLPVFNLNFDYRKFKSKCLRR